MISNGDASLTERETYFKVNPQNHRILKRREIENYLFDKEVLIKYCNENNYDFDSDFYDSFISNIVLDNVKDQASKIKKACSIKTSFNAESMKKRIGKGYNS